MYMNIDDIIKKYEEHWVYLINCRQNERGSVVGGEVAFFDKSMNRVLQSMTGHEGEDDSVYVRYIGELPEGVAILL